MEKRTEQRFDLQNQVFCSFRGNQVCLIENMSLNGLKLTGDFCPRLDSEYSVFIQFENQVKTLRVKIVSAGVIQPEPRVSEIFPEKLIFSINCRIVEASDDTRSFLIYLLEKNFSFLKGSAVS